MNNNLFFFFNKVIYNILCIKKTSGVGFKAFDLLNVFLLNALNLPVHPLDKE